VTGQSNEPGFWRCAGPTRYGAAAGWHRHARSFGKRRPTNIADRLVQDHEGNARVRSPDVLSFSVVADPGIGSGEGSGDREARKRAREENPPARGTSEPASSSMRSVVQQRQFFYRPAAAARRRTSWRGQRCPEADTNASPRRLARGEVTVRCFRTHCLRRPAVEG